MKNYYKCLIVLALPMFNNNISAQQKTFVLTKTITKEYIVSENPKVNIIGEKSDINIQGWSRNSVKIEVELIAKNPKKEKAENELKYINYQINKSGEDYMLSNTFTSDKNIQISSNLSVKYNIWLPENSSIEITNLYGDIKVENLNLKGNISNSFGEIYISDIKGKIDFNMYYSDGYFSGMNAETNSKAKNSTLFFKNCSGMYRITSNYGKISFSAGENLINLFVNSSRTEIEVNVDDIKKYSYNLKTQNSVLNLPDLFAGEIIKESKISSFKHVTDESKRNIIIETTFCPISIIK